MIELIHPRPAERKLLDNQTIEIPDPLGRPEQGKVNLLQRMMPMFIILVMVGVIGMIVVSSGGLANVAPTSLMMPVFMMPAILGGLGTMMGSASLREAIQNWYLQLREVRKQVHQRGFAMFEAQREVFPNPQVLARLVDKNKVQGATMWSVTRNGKAGLAVEPVSDTDRRSAVTFNPYLSARIGLGTVELQPVLEVNPQQITENLEPVTGQAWGKFVRTQRFVPGFPVGLDLQKSERTIIDADTDEAGLALARAMISSLAFNHPPTELRIALVTANPDTSAWRDFKWLPHALASDDGRHRHIYASMADFVAGTQDLRRHRGGHARGAAGKRLEGPLLVVVVDLPDGVDMPEELGPAGVGGFNYLLVSGGPDARDDDDTIERLTLDNGLISLSSGVDLVRADAMSQAEFGIFTRQMSRYRPIGFGTGDGAPVVKAVAKTWFEALGITDIDLFDPTVDWADNDQLRELSFALGNLLTDDKDAEPTGEIQYINIAEAFLGGTGPNGVLQGITGAGKSILLRLIVLSLCARYSPERVNFILLDFKGGATFQDFQRLPHVLGNITNLEQEAELLSRARDVIEGEVTRRQQVFRRYRVENINEYNDLRAQDPTMEPMPNLVIIADEFREFMQKNPDFKSLFESLAQTIRSIGGMMLLCSQFIDYTVIGEVGRNVTYGISLRSSDGSSSTQVIGTSSAMSLPLGTGDAYLKMAVNGKDSLTKFRGFNILENYRAPAAARLPAGSGGRLHALSASEVHAQADESVISTFTSLDANGSEADTVRDNPARHAAADEPVASVKVPGNTLRDRLFERLLDFADVQAPHQLWLPTLVAPITLDDIGADWNAAGAGGGLRVPIGVIDDPRNHGRFPYELVMDGPTAHVHVVGERGIGRSTTLQTIVAGAAVRYRPDAVNFFLVDFGVKLREVKDFPNVSGYGAASDPDMVARLVGEVRRMLAYRERRFAHYGVSTVEQYLDAKAAAGDEVDPYGRIVLVVDNALEFVGTTNDTRDDARVNALVDILTRGSSWGIHVIISSTGSTVHRIDNAIRAFVHHYVQDISALPFAYPNHELRAAAKSIPSTAASADKQTVTQPGRVLELANGLHARIALPIRGHIEPVEVTVDGEFYDYTADYSANIRAFGDELAARTTLRAPTVQTVPEVLSWEPVMQMQQQHLVAGHRSLPLGISAADLTLVSLPDTSAGAPVANMSPHMMVTGDAGSGKTNLLRFLLRYITMAYPAGAAQVWLIDPAMGLLHERDVLAQFGLLGNYVASSRADQIAPAAGALTKVLLERTPVGELSSQQIRSRSFYTGPEVFIVIDNLHMISTSGYGAGPLDELFDELNQRNDRGVNLFASTQGVTFSSDRVSKAPYKSLYESQPTTVLLSGSSTDTLFGSMAAGNAIKFARRRTGQAQVHNTRWPEAPVIQTPLDPSWDV